MSDPGQIVEKVECVHHERFLLLPQCFQKFSDEEGQKAYLCINLIKHADMSAADI